MDPVTTKLLISAGTSILGSFIGRKKRRREQRQANAQLKEMKQQYMNLDFSNPYEDMKNPYDNMENPYEDLTVNLKQANFMAEQQAQRDVNILDALSGSAGASGAAGLAQTVYNQKVKKGQQAAASIGLQESANQRAAAKGQAGIDMAQRKMEGILEQRERAGEVYSRNKEQERTETLYGMAMNRSTMANQARKTARANLIGGVGSALTGFAGTQTGADFFGNFGNNMFNLTGGGNTGDDFVSDTITDTGYTYTPRGFSATQP